MQQEQQAPLREGRQQKTDMSKMKANKEEIDAAGQDYAANEKDKFEPGGTGVAVKQEPIKVGPRLEGMILVLVVVERNIKIVMGKRPDELINK